MVSRLNERIMKNMREEIVNPEHKVGIKILNDTQMMNVFPDFEDVLNRIETHRSWLKEHQIRRFEHYQYNLMYDNVISIFGKRGAGKTSVAFTLHKRIEDDIKHAYDIVLPIIIPEVIPNDGSVLGWLLAIVKDQVTLFEHKLQEMHGRPVYGSSADYLWNNCKVSNIDGMGCSLSEELDKLIELFYSAKYNPANELSYNIAVGNSVRQSQNYYEFAKAIMSFWDHWVTAIQELNKSEKNAQENIAPLIYFIFDDVDLAPQKVDELLSIIIKYLSHPNIIVITTADEEMFLEVIEERLDRDIGRLPKEWRRFLRSSENKRNSEETLDEGSGELVRKTSRRYLGKVMPTSTRYYLKQFNTVEEKRLFYLDDNRELWKGISDQVEYLLEQLPSQPLEKSVDLNFLTHKQVDLDYYLNFLGNTSRQLGNAYIGIKDFIDSLAQIISQFKEKKAEQQKMERKRYVESIYNSAWRFLHISINSNHDLAEKIEDMEAFISEVFWLEHNGWTLYINYAYLNDYLKAKLNIYNKIEQVRMALQLYSLFHFTESIFVILEKCTEGGITGRRRIHGISNLRDFLCEQVFHGQAKMRRSLTAVDFFAHYKTILNRLERMMEEGMQSKKINKEYFYDLSGVLERVPSDFVVQVFRKDRDWLQEISGMLSAVYGNLYLIGKREVENCQAYEKWESLSCYQVVIKKLLEKDVYDALDEFNLLETAKKAIKNMRGLLNQGENSEGDLEKLKSSYKDEFVKRVQKAIQEHGEETQVEESDGAKTILIEPVANLVEEVNQDLSEKSIVYILDLLPEEEASEIKQRLRQEDNSSGMLAILKLLYGLIAEWDLTVQCVYVSNIINVYDAAYGYDDETDYRKELSDLADHIAAYVPDGYEEEEETWYFISDSLYREIKEHLNRIKYARSRRKEHTEGKKQNDIKALTEKIEREFDAAFFPKEGMEFQEALLLAVRVHLAIRIQRLYLYYTVMEKYEKYYDYASKGVEYNKIDGGSQRPTYYYELFLEMALLMKTDYNELKKEERTVKDFIDRSASQSRKEYIRSILQEVNDEPFPN